MQVPPAVCEVFVQRLLKVAQESGWEGSYENADQDIYLLRNRGDAAQVAMKDHVIHVDASDTRRPEFDHFVRHVRDEMAREVSGISMKTASPDARAVTPQSS